MSYTAKWYVVIHVEELRKSTKYLVRLAVNVEHIRRVFSNASARSA